MVPASIPDDAVPRELAEAFDGVVPADEIVLWATLTPEAQTRALARLAAVRAWELDATAGSAEATASALGMSRSRFYRMVSDWRARPSLAALGVRRGAAAPRGERSVYAGANDVLQRLVVDIVANAVAAAASDGRKIAVSELARRLRAAALLEVGEVPKEATLRPIVERELRRRTAEGSPGNEIVFDLSPVGIPDAEGRPHIMFACLDAATRLILGVSIGAIDASRAGYRAAAEDAVVRIGSIPQVLAWAPSLARSQVATGSDAAAWDGFFPMASRAVGANVQPKGGGERFGRDIRRLIGASLGSTRVMTLDRSREARMTVSTTASRFTCDQARLRLEPDVQQHNADILAGRASRSRRPTPGMMALLRLVAA